MSTTVLFFLLGTVSLHNSFGCVSKFASRFLLDKALLLQEGNGNKALSNSMFAKKASSLRQMVRKLWRLIQIYLEKEPFKTQKQLWKRMKGLNEVIHLTSGARPSRLHVELGHRKTRGCSATLVFLRTHPFKNTVWFIPSVTLVCEIRHCPRTT